MCFAVIRYVNEHLAIYSCGHLCTNSIWVLIAAWLNASQISRDGGQLNRSACELSVKCSEQPKGMDTPLNKSLPF